MTRDDLARLYFTERARLIDLGVRCANWTVYVSPRDAMDLNSEAAAHFAPFPYEGELYGARWEIDPTGVVAAGTIWINAGIRLGERIRVRPPARYAELPGKTGKTLTTHGWSADPGKDNKA